MRLTRDGAVLEYEVAGTSVQEWVSGTPGRNDVVVRHFEIGPAARTTWLLLGVTAPGADVSLAAEGRERPALERLPIAAGTGPRAKRRHTLLNRLIPIANSVC